MKLSGTANGAGVSLDGGSSYMIDPSPDGNHVVFVGQFDSATDEEIYSAPVAGAAASAVKLHAAAATSPSFVVEDYAISYDSQYVVWRGNFNSATQDLFRATIGTASSSTQINPASTSMGAHYKFWLSRNSLKMAFAADVDATPSQMDLFTVDLSNIGGTTVKVHDIANTAVEFHNLVFNSDNTKIAYFVDDIGNDIYKIFSAVVGSASSAVNRTHTNALITPDTLGGNYEHGKGPVWIDSSDYVLYEASATPQAAADLGLYQFSLGDGNPGALVTQALAAGQEVKGNTLGYGKAFYTVDVTTDNTYQLFSFVPGVNTLTELTVLGPRLATVLGAHIPEAQEQLPNFPNLLAIVGKFPGSTTEDIYLVPDHNDLSGIRKVTHAYSGTDGVGRFQLRLLEYKADPAGTVAVTGPGMETACLSGPAIDGLEVDLEAEGISFPAGGGSTLGLFALAIDVYGEAADLDNDGVANDCVGTFNRILLPKGLADAASSPQASRLRLTDSGSYPVLFVKD